MTAGSFLTKVIGGYTLYLVGKDSNRFGKAFKNKNPQAKIAESFPDMYINTQRIELSKTVLPTIVCDAKKSYFDYYLRDSWFPFMHGVTGYINGVFTGICHNILPAALGIGALAFSKGTKEVVHFKKKTVKGKEMFFEKITNPKTGIVTFKYTKYPYLREKVTPFLKSNGGKFCAGLLLLGAFKYIGTRVCGFGDYKKL